MTRSAPLYLLGQSNLPSQQQDYAGDVSYNQTAQNDVQIWFNSANVGNNLISDNVFTGVLTVGPTLNATLTGSGPTGFPVPEDTPFGCEDFRAYNIDFRNEYAPYSNGPAHAMGVSRANAGFYSCGFYSWQDTVGSLPPYLPIDIPALTIRFLDIRRQASQRLLLRHRRRRPDRLPVRVWHTVHHKVYSVAASLWRWYYRLEGCQHDLREQVRRLHRLVPTHRQQRLHSRRGRGPVRPWPPVERPAALHLHGQLL